MRRENKGFRIFEVFGIFLLFLLTAIFSGDAQAKRGPAPEVTPLELNGYRYSAPHTEMGVIEAVDMKTEKKRWDMKVYDIIFNDNLERDVQWVFIKRLSFNRAELIVIDEKDNEYLVPLDLTETWGEKGYDGSARYRLMYSRYKEGYLELWVDAKETVDEVGEIRLVFSNGKSISSTACWKAQRHEKAPWACQFPQEQLKLIGPEKGKIQCLDRSGKVLLEETFDFESFGDFAKRRVRFYY